MTNWFGQTRMAGAGPGHRLFVVRLVIRSSCAPEITTHGRNGGGICTVAGDDSGARFEFDGTDHRAGVDRGFLRLFYYFFAFAKESVPLRLAGTVSGITNMGVIQGPMFMQPLVGLVLDQSWAGTMLNGKRIFSFEAYSKGFLLIFIWAVVALLLLAFVSETHYQQTR